MSKKSRHRYHRRHTRKHRGGGSTVFPLKYFNENASEPSAPKGHDLLHASGLGVRPKIGGFVPSVMGNFVAGASKYITPLALFAGYKLMTRKTKHRTRHRRR